MTSGERGIPPNRCSCHVLLMAHDQPSRSARQRLALLALDVLDEAFVEADREPIERTPLHRLALGYLLFAGWANRAQVTSLWEVLGHEGQFEQMSCRQSHFGCMSHHIRQCVVKAGTSGVPR